MTVSELIESLKKVDPSYKITIGIRKSDVSWTPTDITKCDTSKEFNIYCNDYDDIPDDDFLITT